MIVVSTKNFDKDILKIKDKKLAVAVRKIIAEIHDSANIVHVRNVKKMKSHGSYYRVRCGDYRLGFKMGKSYSYTSLFYA